MFDIGFLELMVVAVLGLLVLGPERLPKAARTAGLFIGKIRRTMNNLQDDLERQVRTEELREKLKDPYATFLDDDTPAKPAHSQPQPSAEPEALPAGNSGVSASDVTDGNDQPTKASAEASDSHKPS